MFTLKFWLDAASNGAYVSLHRPFNNLLDNFSTAKIDSKKLFFIDCVTKNEMDIPNCYFIGNEKDLKSIYLALSSHLKFKKSSFVFIDSLTSLCLCNDEKSVLRFSKNMIKKIHSKKLNGIIIGVSDNHHKKFLEEISAHCDETIDLNEIY
jgi:archaellum biogenesis ATPase FlaH